MELTSVVIIWCMIVSFALGYVNDRPIIGIFTQPSDDDVSQYGTQFIAASYVKYIESAGARVSPIRYDLSTEELTTLFNSINGVLFPGGGVDFGTEHVYWQNANLLWNLITSANEKGDYFPLWGTCLGFQEINLLRSQNMSLLASTDSENYTIPITFTSAASSSRIFSGAPSNVMNILAKEPVTMNNHQYSVLPSSYSENSKLGDFFDILSTSVDRNGIEFISTIEAKQYPIYASQWHPEKVAFEWNIHEVTNHSPDSLTANGWVQNFFVNEARKSQHAFATVEDETASLIYNYQPIYIYSIINDFEQGYFFNSVPYSVVN